MTTMTKDPETTSPYADRKICLSTTNLQMEGMRVLDYIPERTTDDIHQDTLAVNAEVRTRNEWLHKFGPGPVRTKMIAWLTGRAYSAYDERVPEHVGDDLQNPDLTLAEVEDLFFRYYPAI